MNKIKLIEQEYTKKEYPKVNIGDTVKVLTKIPEGDKVRLHPFEGVVIAKKRLRHQQLFHGQKNFLWRRY